MDTAAWNEPDPALIVVPANDDEWDSIFERYRGSANDMPFQRCVDIARELGAVTVVVETRYVDLDYRSEFHALYGRMHADVPAYAHRIHFFGSDIGEDLANLKHDPIYLGYVSVRPVAAGLVSRAMLQAPPSVPAVQSSVTETVGFFGQPLKVTGVPFSQQDTSLGACAHAAAWTCYHTAYLRGDVARRPRADFALHADPSLSPARALPSGGLTVSQLADVLRRFDLPAIFYQIGALPTPGLWWQPASPASTDPNALPGTWDSRIFAVVCRHLNGGYPVLVGTQDHAFVLVGYGRRDDGKIVFVRHDDQRGPYLLVENPLDDQIRQSDGTDFDYGPWRTLQVPLPPKLWLAPEVAERKAGSMLFGLSGALSPLVKRHTGQEVETLGDLVKTGRLALRTYAIASEIYKEKLVDLGFELSHVQGYRLARLPRHVWVVEVIDRRLRGAGMPSVLGEALVDASSADVDPNVVAFRLHGAQVIQSPSGTTRGPNLAAAAPTLSGGAGMP